MLGIRHFKGSAIDLYLGDITEFCSDVIVTACNPDLSPKSQQDKSILITSGSKSFDSAKDTQFNHLMDAPTGNLPCSKLAIIKAEGFGQEFKNSLSSSLDYAREHKQRHVSFPLWLENDSIENAGKKFFNSLKQYLESKEGSELRITVVLDSKEDYFKFQDEMF